jgi:hypothetical protein
MNYVFIFFLPGAAGNFFGRSLNLLENFYSYGNKQTMTLPETLEEKIRLLSYGSVTDKKFEDRNWITFENDVVEYFHCRPHWDLPKDAYGVFKVHPGTKGKGNNSMSKSSELSGQDDKVFKFYIDSSEVFEWTFMNALYKNTPCDANWLIEAKKIQQDPSVNKINLKNIITSKEKFFEEFAKVCAIMGHAMSQQEAAAVGDLYDQWQKTTLKQEDIPAFKEKIGWPL